MADKYASTPTGAAEIAVPDIESVYYDLEQERNYLNSLVHNKIISLENKLLYFKNKKYFQNLDSSYDNYLEKLNGFKNILKVRLENKITYEESKVKNIKNTLEFLNPDNLLKKGYSILLNKDNKVVSSIKDVSIKEELKVKTSDGYIISEVKGVE